MQEVVPVLPPEDEEEEIIYITELFQLISQLSSSSFCSSRLYEKTPSQKPRAVLSRSHVSE